MATRATRQEPADTRIMGVVHSALRRDLARSRAVLAEGELSEDRRQAVAEHLVWMMDFLHHHHAGEDDGLYPLLLAHDPSAAGILAEMDGEHKGVHPGMDRVRSAATALTASAEARAEAHDAIVELEQALLPHLEREELELMPRVSAALTEQQWDEWDQQFNIKPKGKRQLADEGHWLIDGVDEETRRAVAALLPPVPRFVVLNLLGGPYRRRRTRLWAGTAADAIPSLSLSVP